MVAESSGNSLGKVGIDIFQGLSFRQIRFLSVSFIA